MAPVPRASGVVLLAMEVWLLPTLRLQARGLVLRIGMLMLMLMLTLLLVPTRMLGLQARAHVAELRGGLGEEQLVAQVGALLEAAVQQLEDVAARHGESLGGRVLLAHLQVPPSKLVLVEEVARARVYVAAEERGVLEQGLGRHDGRGSGLLEALLSVAVARHAAVGNHLVRVKVRTGARAKG